MKSPTTPLRSTPADVQLPNRSCLPPVRLRPHRTQGGPASCCRGSATSNLSSSPSISGAPNASCRTNRRTVSPMRNVKNVRLYVNNRHCQRVCFPSARPVAAGESASVAVLREVGRIVGIYTGIQQQLDDRREVRLRRADYLLLNPPPLLPSPVNGRAIPTNSPVTPHPSRFRQRIGRSPREGIRTRRPPESVR